MGYDLIRRVDACGREILWIDDVADEVSVRILTHEGFRTEFATSGESGLARARAKRFDAYIIDLCLPDMYGLTVLERLSAEGLRAPAVVLTGCYTEPEAERVARQLGAADFRCKPFSADELGKVLRTLIETKERSAAPSSQSSSPSVATTAGCVEPRFGIVAVSPAMRAVIEWIDRIGPSEMTVLLTGETGTGKELVAKALHESSHRRARPFLALNCSAIPEGLLESELFGHCRGSFTGAFRDKRGLVEESHMGTLFLDEVGDLSLPGQARLLRFLETGELRRVGGTHNIRVDVRVVAATNRSLMEATQERAFRSDLYFRLAAARRHLPPLRQRTEDVDALAEYWLKKLVPACRKEVLGITPDALQLLRMHPWPGNVREFRNVVECAISLADGGVLTSNDIAGALSGAASERGAVPDIAEPKEDLAETLTALEKSRWNQTRAAQILGIDRSTLWRRLRKYGLSRSNSR